MRKSERDLRNTTTRRRCG